MKRYKLLKKTIICLLPCTLVTSTTVSMFSCANDPIETRIIDHIDLVGAFDGNIIWGHKEDFTLIAKDENDNVLNDSDLDLSIDYSLEPADLSFDDYLSINKKTNNSFEFIAKKEDEIFRSIDIPVYVTSAKYNFESENAYIHILNVEHPTKIILNISQTEFKQGDETNINLDFLNVSEEKIPYEDIAFANLKIEDQYGNIYDIQNNTISFNKSGNFNLQANYKFTSDGTNFQTIYSNILNINVTQDLNINEIKYKSDENEIIHLIENVNNYHLEAVALNKFNEEIPAEFNWTIEQGFENYLVINNNDNFIPKKPTVDELGNIFSIGVYGEANGFTGDKISLKIQIHTKQEKIITLDENYFNVSNSGVITSWNDDAIVEIQNEINKGKKIELNLENARIAWNCSFAEGKPWFYNNVVSINLTNAIFLNNDDEDMFSGYYSFSNTDGSVINYPILEKMILNNVSFANPTKKKNVDYKTGCNTFSNCNFQNLTTLDCRNIKFSSFEMLKHHGIIKTGYHTFEGSNFPKLETFNLNDAKFSIEYMHNVFGSTYATLYSADNTFANTTFKSLKNLNLDNTQFAAHHQITSSGPTHQASIIHTAYHTFDSANFSVLEKLDLSKAIFSVDNPVQDPTNNSKYNVYSGDRTFNFTKFPNIKTIDMQFDFTTEDWNNTWISSSSLHCFEYFFDQAFAPNCESIIIKFYDHYNKKIKPSTSTLAATAFNFIEVKENGILHYINYNSSYDSFEKVVIFSTKNWTLSKE